MIEKQLALFPTQGEALAKTFTGDAIVITKAAIQASDTSYDLATSIPRLEGQKELASAKPAKLVAGGVPGAVWFYADLEIKFTDPAVPQPITKRVRSVELLDGAQEWKTAAATFCDITSMSSSADNPTLPGATPPGPLAKFLTSPSDVAAALANDPSVVVLGTDPKEEAVGPDAAKALLQSWSKLQLSLNGNAVREVHGKTWGYALANVDLARKDGNPYRLGGLVIATLSGDQWKVVALHYCPL